MNQNILNKYIEALIDNVNPKNIPKEMDIVFDGGAFNGSIGQGILLYIKSLTKKYNIKINRVSGCSIGAVLATIFLSNITYDYDGYFKIISKSLKKNINLKKYNIILKKIIFKEIKDDNLTHLNNRLFISYYDMKKKKTNYCYKVS